jgi:hypothetical protein
MLFAINIILGIALLVSGRKLFWLLIAAAGFIAGVQIATSIWHSPEWLAILIGLICGILFSVLAITLKNLAIGIAGFLLGGSILVSLAGMLNFNNNGFTWIIYVIGGIIGIILVSVLFDWALIGLSAFGGAALIIQTLNLSNPASGLVFFVLLIIGISIQLVATRREKTKLDKR